MHDHIVQSKEWAEVKNKYGTKAVEVDGAFYTKHKVPFLNKYYAYCPRVNPFKINFEKLKKSLKENNCIGISFDVPNVLKGSPDEKRATEVFEQYCKKSKRSEFAKGNFLLDLKKSEKELFESMHSKQRYNTRYALKKGITVRLAENKEDFEIFFGLYKNTAIRQGYFIRPKKYYEIIWEELFPKKMCDILIAEYHGKPLVAWMVFIYDKVIYYPYGGSTIQHRKLFPSNAIGWEVIRYGKSRDCEMFDMWGAAEKLEDKKDPYYGFTSFKSKFGAEHVNYISSYDLAINKPLYFLFTTANKIRWQLLELGIIK